MKPATRNLTPVQVGQATIARGERQRVEIPVARLPTETWLSLPVEVMCGARPGPRLWLSAAVHGDELNGVEIIRRVIKVLEPPRLRGTIFAAPIVNVFGFMNQSRYLPDRRDLNRCFPGSRTGSLASRLAHLFMTEIVNQCTHGIDLHTGSNHRTNLPQVRCNLQDPETRRCAQAFGTPVIVDAQSRDGSLRQAATKRGIHALVYEAGEPMRFDPQGIRLGVEGVFRVLSVLRMWKHPKRAKRTEPIEVVKSTWVRARRSGIVRLHVELGEHVEKKQSLGTIADTFGDNSVTVKAPDAGVVIGQTNNPLVNRGDAIVHLALKTAKA